jgi:hypothetical protein
MKKKVQKIAKQIGSWIGINLVINVLPMRKVTTAKAGG